MASPDRRGIEALSGADPVDDALSSTIVHQRFTPFSAITEDPYADELAQRSAEFARHAAFDDPTPPQGMPQLGTPAPPPPVAWNAPPPPPVEGPGADTDPPLAAQLTLGQRFGMAFGDLHAHDDPFADDPLDERPRGEHPTADLLAASQEGDDPLPRRQAGQGLTESGYPPPEPFVREPGLGLPPTDSLGRGAVPQSNSFGRDRLPQADSLARGALPHADSFGRGGLPQADSLGRGGLPQADSQGFGGFAQAGSPGRDGLPQAGSPGRGGLPQADSVGLGGLSRADSLGRGGLPQADSLGLGGLPLTGPPGRNGLPQGDSSGRGGYSQADSAGFGGLPEAETLGRGGLPPGDSPGFGGFPQADSPAFGGLSQTDSPGFGGSPQDSPGFGGLSRVDSPGFGGSSHDPPGFGGFSQADSPGFGGSSHDSLSFDGSPQDSAGFGGFSQADSPGFGGQAAGDPPGFAGVPQADSGGLSGGFGATGVEGAERPRQGFSSGSLGRFSPARDAGLGLPPADTTGLGFSGAPEAFAHEGLDLAAGEADRGYLSGGETGELAQDEQDSAEADDLPQRIPAEPDVPSQDVVKAPTDEPAPLKDKAQLSRIASHLRQKDVPSEDRPDGFDVQAVLAAVRAVAGIREASMRTTPTGAHHLRLELAEGADPGAISRMVARMLQDQMGIDAALMGGPGQQPSIPAQAEPSPDNPPVMPPRPRSGLGAAPPPATENRPEPSPRPEKFERPEQGREPRRRHPVSVPRRPLSELRPSERAAATWRSNAENEQQPGASPPAIATDRETGPRAIIDHVQTSTFGLDATVEVRLTAGERHASGVSSGPAVDAYVLRLCAAATAAAVDDLLRDGTSTGETGRCFVEHAAIVPMGSCDVAVVVVLLVCGGWVEQLAGSALVSGDPRRAVVRATLSAVNRRLAALLP